MSSRYQALETDIRNRLAQAGTGYEYEVTPENADEVNNKPFVKARISVMYLFSEFSSRSDLGLPEVHEIGSGIQREFAEVSVAITARKLRGPGGAYEAMDAARKRLLGYQPTGWGRMLLSRQEMSDNAKGYFVWVQTWKTSAPLVQIDEPEQEIGGDLTAVTIEYAP